MDGMDRAQLSFEFLLYLSVAVLGLIGGYGLFNMAKIGIAGSYGNSSIEAFASQIGYNMAFQNSSFYSIVPKGVCADDGHIINNISNGANSISAHLDAPLYINLHLCNWGSTVQLLRMHYTYNGTYILADG